MWLVCRCLLPLKLWALLNGVIVSQTRRIKPESWIWMESGRRSGEKVWSGRRGIKSTSTPSYILLWPTRTFNQYKHNYATTLVSVRPRSPRFREFRLTLNDSKVRSFFLLGQEIGTALTGRNCIKGVVRVGQRRVGLEPEQTQCQRQERKIAISVWRIVFRFAQLDNIIIAGFSLPSLWTGIQ